MDTARRGELGSRGALKAIASRFYQLRLDDADNWRHDLEEQQWPRPPPRDLKYSKLPHPKSKMPPLRIQLAVPFATFDAALIRKAVILKDLWEHAQ